jgi:hypothetical protein
VALKAFRLFVRESFCARCLAIAPDRGIFDRRAANRTQRQKASAVLPAAAPMSQKMKDAITKRSRPQFGTWRDFTSGISRTVWPRS